MPSVSCASPHPYFSVFTSALASSTAFPFFKHATLAPPGGLCPCSSLHLECHLLSLHVTNSCSPDSCGQKPWPSTTSPAALSCPSSRSLSLFLPPFVFYSLCFFPQFIFVCLRSISSREKVGSPRKDFVRITIHCYCLQQWQADSRHSLNIY